MAAFSQGDEFFCIINSGDSIDELADEIGMRVSAATRFILERTSYSKIKKAYPKLYTVEQARSSKADGASLLKSSIVADQQWKEIPSSKAVDLADME